MAEDITNIEEKKRIIAFYKCLYNQYPENMLCNSRIYDVWLRKWKNDFVIEGKCLKMWHQKFVESVGKHRKHIEAPAYYAEYNKMINDVTDFVNEHYNPKRSRADNHLHCKELLRDYRISCLDELNKMLSNNVQNEMSISIKNPNDFMGLSKYVLEQNGEIIYSAFYDEMKKYIIERGLI